VIEALRHILACAQSRCGDQFSGTGVIVADKIEILPILALRSDSRPTMSGDTTSVLAAISILRSEYHDGFHVLDSNLRLQLVSQYFSPPIVEGISLDRSRNFGGRYVAALFGSVLRVLFATLEEQIEGRTFAVQIIPWKPEARNRARSTEPPATSLPVANQHDRKDVRIDKLRKGCG
jgi:hypothetical protein